MSFFYAEKEREPRAKPKPRLQDIPVTTLRQMGCGGCPRNDDDSLRTPKMRPEGRKDAPVYLLGTSPSRDDDETDEHWVDDYTGEVFNQFGKDFMHENVRSNYTMQCRHGKDESEADQVVATECCRQRIISDIEETKPRVVVTIGDAPMRWALGVSGTAPQLRGAPFSARFGKHTCLVVPLIYPNYVAFWKKGAGSRKRTNAKGRSTFEVCVDHDTKMVKRWVRGDEPWPPVDFQGGPYDAGIELLTGNQPGDILRLERRLVELARHPKSAVDIETTGLRPYMLKDPRLLTAAVGTFGDTLAFPIDHPDGWATTKNKQRAKELFAEYLLHSGRKAAHQVGFEMEWFEYEFGAYLLRRTEWDDTMAQAFVLDGRPGTKSLDMRCRMKFGFFLKDQSRVDVSRPEWWTLYTLEETLRYNGMDTKWCDRLRDVQDAEMDRDDYEGRLREQYEQHVRLAPTLVLTQAPGLAVDFEYARELDADMSDSMKRVDKELGRCTEVQKYEDRYGRFSPTNPDHVLRLMKDMLDRPEVRREDRDGHVTFTTDEEALAAIPKSEVPSARLVLEHREVSKLHTTYVVPVLERKIVCVDGRVRSKYSSLTAVTNRLASEDPNIQNFPKRKHKYVRGMLRPKRDLLAPCDYGQIEFRVVGMASRDPNLVKYCWTGYDVHKYWAERMIREYGPIVDWVLDEFDDSLAAIKKKQGKEYDEDAAILKTLRQEAKNKWVFPQLFGSTARSCAINLHLPLDVADELAGEFWDEFRDVKKWQEEIGRFYEKYLYVETLNGHRRRGAMTANEMVNLPIQGTAAEIVKAAQNALSERAEAEEDPELQPVINVHDDLTFDLWEDTFKQKQDIIVREMCEPRFDFINVPLVVEVSKGTRWDNAEEVGVFRSHEVFGTPNPYAP